MVWIMLVMTFDSLHLSEKYHHLSISTQVLWLNIQKTHLVKTSGQLYKQFKNANPRLKV